MKLSTHARVILSHARETYGNRNQISVAIEELNELACVLCKYIRFDNNQDAVKELQPKVIDELADVLVVIDHIKAIFGVDDRDIEFRAEAKVERVNNWLQKSKSMHQTMVDREVPDVDKGQLNFLAKHCSLCANSGDRSVCEHCVDGSLYAYRNW